ncbi:MAG: DUF2200 domain-containing protein [Spirochaetes bacterium]|nr:DUF2200 domain-containing protein [Spirochaetota bacterium]
MKFSTVYPLYVQKVERKGRTRDELDAVISWFTGYTPAALQQQLAAESDFQSFFANTPQLNPAASKISGVICGIRVEDIEDPLVQQVRRLDKLVDELAKGKAMEKILRQ